MYQMTVNESDWKKFRAKLPGWQNAYMQRLLDEYAELIARPGEPSDKFWALEKRIWNDKKSVGVVARMSRSYMYPNLISLLGDEVITLDDLKDFSDDLREKLAFVNRDR